MARFDRRRQQIDKLPSRTDPSGSASSGERFKHHLQPVDFDLDHDGHAARKRTIRKSPIVKPDQIRLRQLDEPAPFGTPERHRLSEVCREFLCVCVEHFDRLFSREPLIHNVLVKSASLIEPDFKDPT